MNVSCIKIRSGINKVTAPRIKFVTVAVTVTRRFVPKCSDVDVTNTDKYPQPKPINNEVR